jgi:hypothetical protein
LVLEYPGSTYPSLVFVLFALIDGLALAVDYRPMCLIHAVFHCNC